MDSNSEKTEEQKKELPSSLQKICLVCGDKALGYNFNAISCESCKAFFRRNAKVNKPVKCPFNNNCVITVVTRRFCQKCRLEKCLSIGMVKEFILSEEDKAMKRRKIEENRAKKRQLNEPDDGISSSKCMKRDDEASTYIPQGQNLLQYDAMNSSCSPSSTVQSPMHSDLEASMHSPSYYAPVQPTEQPYIMKVHPIDEKNSSQRPFDMEVPESYNMYENADTNSYTDPPKQSIRDLLTNGDKAPVREEEPHACNQPPPLTNDPDMNKAMEILQDVERIEPNTMELILCEAIKLEFAAFSSVSAYSNPSRELNEVERAKLNELIVANKMLHAPIEADLTQLIVDTPALKECDGKHDPRLLHIVNITAVAIRRFIKMAKKINAFKNMCEADQVALLKGGCIEMMVLRSTMTYDTQRKSWTIPHGEEEYCSIETGVLKLAKGNIYRTHEAFIRTFEPHWRADENVILVMSAILLFTPTRAMVVHKDVIKLEQYSYYYLLRRYLESIYPGCEAKSTFLKLIEKIIELRKLSEEITGVYLDVNPIEPLLMEIFDLKHHAA